MQSVFISVLSFEPCLLLFIIKLRPKIDCLIEGISIYRTVFRWYNNLKVYGRENDED